MVESHVTVFLGGEEPAKREKLHLLEEKLFPVSLRELNTTVLYADDKDLTPALLQEALACLPTAGASRRLVVVKSAHRLNKSVLDVLCEACRRPPSSCVLVIDVPDLEAGEKAVAALNRNGAQIVRFRSKVPPDVFDLGRAILSRRPQEALKVLADVLADRQKPEKLMGALLWQWEKGWRGGRISREVYRKGLALMVATDRRFKTSSARRQGPMLLELLVVKLSYLA